MYDLSIYIEFLINVWIARKIGYLVWQLAINEFNQKNDMYSIYMTRFVLFFSFYQNSFLHIIEIQSSITFVTIIIVTSLATGPSFITFICIFQKNMNK